MDRLPLSTTTLFQQFTEQVISDELSRDLGDLSGTFVFKEIKGKTYCYLQYHEAGKQKQAYVGPENEKTNELISNWDAIRQESKLNQQRRREMCSMLKAGGMLTTDPSIAKVLAMFTDSGIFRMGVVLVGTQAFRSYGNMLGIKLAGTSLQTHDIDLAQDFNINIALPNELNIDIADVIERAEMGFIPIPSLNNKQPSTSFKVRRKEIKLDLLTPLIGKPEQGPIKSSSLNTYAHPLRFLDYLIDNPVQTVLIDNSGLLVNVPHPARYALHKCIITNRRSITEKAKREKDLYQAQQLLEILLDDDSQAIISAWNELKPYGKNWQEHVIEGLKKLSDKNLAGKLHILLKI